MTKAIVEEGERLMKDAAASLRPAPAEAVPVPAEAPATPRPTATNRTATVATPALGEQVGGHAGRKRRAGSPAPNPNAGVWAKVEYEEGIPPEGGDDAVTSESDPPQTKNINKYINYDYGRNRAYDYYGRWRPRDARRRSTLGKSGDTGQGQRLAHRHGQRRRDQQPFEVYWVWPSLY